MLYSVKRKLDRRNAVMAAVKKELKAHNAYVAPELLQKLAEALDTSCYYHIEVIRDVEKAAAALRLSNHQTSHSWAGGDGFKEECSAIVFGEITMGEDYSSEYFDNGNSTGPREQETDGQFNINRPFTFLKHVHDWRDWERDCCNHDDEYDTIVIYAPEGIVDEAAYTAQKDAELAEICQLRYNLPKAE